MPATTPLQAFAEAMASTEMDSVDGWRSGGRVGRAYVLAWKIRSSMGSLAAPAVPARKIPRSRSTVLREDLGNLIAYSAAAFDDLTVSHTHADSFPHLPIPLTNQSTPRVSCLSPRLSGRRSWRTSLKFYRQRQNNTKATAKWKAAFFCRQCRFAGESSRARRWPNGAGRPRRAAHGKTQRCFTKSSFSGGRSSTTAFGKVSIPPTPQA